MKFTILPTLLCVATVVQAIPFAVPIPEAKYELTNVVKRSFEKRFHPDDLDRMYEVFEKRDDSYFSLDGILDLVNNSGVIWDVLDQVAYYPSRIQKLANVTADLIGNFNLSSISALLSINLDLNYSAIYYDVMDSGVVSSLLDGILLDEDYRPVLVNLTSRVLEGNKNLFNYLVKDIFKKLKRGFFDKRDTSGTLETFVGNIISSALSSLLVADISSDVLVALNDTQFLTYTVKTFIADEGYQNMTAQLVLDIIETGKVSINSKAINITSIANSLLSNPAVIVSVVSNLLSGNVKLPGLGKYTSAVSAIVKDVENQGVFEDLNNYVFSETHSVTKPLIATNQIVVARTSLSVSATTTSTKKTNSTTTKTSSSNTKTTVSASTGGSSEESSMGSSAAEVASILSELRASITTTGSTSTSTSRSSTSDTSGDAAAALDLIALLNGASSTSTSTAASTTTTSALGLLDILAGLGSSSTSANAKRDVATVATANGASASQPNNLYTKVLVAMNAVLLGGVMLL